MKFFWSTLGLSCFLAACQNQFAQQAPVYNQNYYPNAAQHQPMMPPQFPQSQLPPQQMPNMPPQALPQHPVTAMPALQAQQEHAQWLKERKAALAAEQERLKALEQQHQAALAYEQQMQKQAHQAAAEVEAARKALLKNQEAVRQAEEQYQQTMNALNGKQQNQAWANAQPPAAVSAPKKVTPPPVPELPTVAAPKQPAGSASNVTNPVANTPAVPVNVTTPPPAVSNQTSASVTPPPPPPVKAEPVVRPEVKEEVKTEPTKVAAVDASKDKKESGNEAISSLLKKASDSIGRGDLDGAAGYLENAQRLSPNNSKILYDIANVRYHQGRYRDAELFASRAVRAGGANHILKKSWSLIANARKALGDNQGAVTAAEKAASF